MNDSRRRNRKAITRLFQGFVKDYGDVAGEKIIKHIVDQTARLRIRIPSPGPDPLERSGKAFRCLWRSTCERFGRASGRAIMNKIMVELNGRRWFPDHEVVYREERNRIICALYNNGSTISELAMRFSLCEDQIRKIVNKDEQNVI